MLAGKCRAVLISASGLSLHLGPFITFYTSCLKDISVQIILLHFLSQTLLISPIFSFLVDFSSLVVAHWSVHYYLCSPSSIFLWICTFYCFQLSKSPQPPWFSIFPYRGKNKTRTKQKTKRTFWNKCWQFLYELIGLILFFIVYALGWLLLLGRGWIQQTDPALEFGAVEEAGRKFLIGE